MTDWRGLARRTAYWTLPPGIQAIIRSRLNRSRTLTSEKLAVLQRNRALRNRHAGERCFILATGPSIREQDLTLLQGEICFAVSNFFVHPDFATIQPRYYCVAGYHEPITEAAWIEWLREMEAATGAATMFFSLNDRERTEHNGLFRGRQVHYLQFGASRDGILRRGIDLARPVLGPQSVPVMALEIAIYMGFRHIYLLGCDHDWILHLHTSTHFYEESQHALVRQGYNEWSDAPRAGYLERQCQHLISLWQQYKVIQSIAQAKSIRIFNATEGGLLDVFPRIRYESLFDRDGAISQTG